MNGVDYHDQMGMKYEVGHFSVKARKYILWYILYCEISTRQTRKNYAHHDF